MNIILSPAKTLDYNPSDTKNLTQPRFIEESNTLIKKLKTLSVKKIMKLMDVSEKIAILNAERYAGYEYPFPEGTFKQAVLAFKGDVYQDLKADTFEEDELDFAQKRLRILSGLYGLLRPCDAMYPYRLEMGTDLSTGRKKNLYEFWGNKITELLNQDIKESGSDYLINLASNEYSSAVRFDKIQAKVIQVQFLEDRNGKLKVVSFNAKRARGAMSRQIILGKLSKPEELLSLNINGYQYDAKSSSDEKLIFIKEE